MRFFHKYTGLSRKAFPYKSHNHLFMARRNQLQTAVVRTRRGSLSDSQPFNVHSKMKTYTLTLIALFFLTFASVSPVAQAQGQMALTQEAQDGISPDRAIEMLKEGNARFMADDMLDRDHSDFVSATATGQYPHAVVLGCIDSRVPPELVFDQGVGDIFSVRIAGNFVNTDILGSMEFATAVAGSKVIVVLGHTSCGAVKGACDHVEMGNLTHLLSNIMPAVYGVEEVIGERSSKNTKFVNDVAHTNVELTVQNILDRSTVISDLVEAGKVKVVGAMHDVETGKVTFMD